MSEQAIIVFLISSDKFRSTTTHAPPTTHPLLLLPHLICGPKSLTGKSQGLLLVLQIITLECKKKKKEILHILAYKSNLKHQKIEIKSGGQLICA